MRVQEVRVTYELVGDTTKDLAMMVAKGWNNLRVSQRTQECSISRERYWCSGMNVCKSQVDLLYSGTLIMCSFIEAFKGM